ncbi:MAG: hypothetical protein KC912_07125 [Proteobacteria bacterium]|nr:hypothetical protein [Pseudomonadota bacterium]
MTEASEATARLKFHLEMQDSFWFALVVGPDEQARAVLRDVAGQYGPVVDFDLESGEEVATAIALLGPREGLAWVRVEDSAVASALLAAMNERREAFRRGHGAGVVVEGPLWLKAVLRNAAPDLFSIRACILEPSPPDDQPLQREITEEVFPSWAPRVTPAPLPDAQARTGINRELRRAASLAESDDASSRRARIASLRRAAGSLLDQGWIGEAAGIVDELVELVYEVPDDLWVMPERAIARELEGQVARQVGDLDETREAFEAALEAIHNLRQGRPLDGSTATLQEDEARLWWSLGEVAWASGELPRAQACLGRALRLREELLEFRSPHEDLSALREGIARTFSLLADVAEAAGRDADAADAWIAALEIRSDLVELRPADGEAVRSLSISLGRVAKVAQREGDWSGALELRARAWSLAQGLADAEPLNAVWLVEASTARTRLAQLLLQLDRLNSARTHLDAVHHVRRDLTERDPDNMDWSYRFAATLVDQAELALASAEPEQALQHTLVAQRRLEALREEDPDRIIWALTHLRALEALGEASWQLGDYGGSAVSFALACAGLGHLLEQDARPRWLRRLSRLHTRQGDAYFAAGDDESAANAWTLALAGSEEPLTRQHLGPLVGLAQLGELPETDALALIAQLEQSGGLTEGQATSWRAALELRGSAD